MYIRIDPSSGVPIWQQVVAQATRQTVSGAMTPGEQLPTVRELASDLRVNPNTIAKAYQELERSGVVATKRGLGTFVLEQPVRTSGAEAMRSLHERIDAAIIEAMQLRLDAAGFIAVVEERIAHLTQEAAPGTPQASEALQTVTEVSV